MSRVGTKSSSLTSGRGSPRPRRLSPVLSTWRIWANTSTVSAPLPGLQDRTVQVKDCPVPGSPSLLGR